MLQCHTVAGVVLLHALCKAGSSLAGQKRVFGVILKVPSAEGISVDIHTGTKGNMYTVFFQFHSVVVTNPGCRIHIPGLGQHHSHRECGAVVAHQVQTGRTVAHGKSGNTQGFGVLGRGLAGSSQCNGIAVFLAACPGRHRMLGFLTGAGDDAQ